MKVVHFLIVPLATVALQVPTTTTSSSKKTRAVESFDPLHLSNDEEEVQTPVLPPLMAGVVTALTFPLPALAKGGEYGLCEGRVISMIHPTIMASCFFTSLAAGYTGYQWRRLRELNAELSAAKKEAKAAMSEEDEGPPTSPLVESLSAEVSKLRDGNFRELHYTCGNILLALGIPIAIEGPVNTYMRAAKLFPGPHLYAGAAVVALWGIAASLVPQMQKGKDWARTTHIGLNAVNVALFAYYQLPTGWEITQKVIQNTKFP